VPKELPDLTDRILGIVAGVPDGAGKAEIAHALKKMASSRTVTRRLAELVAANRLATKGKSRALRYTLPAVGGAGALVASAAGVTGEGTVEPPV